jgi:Phage integrase, N-terminal SAM-like domain
MDEPARAHHRVIRSGRRCRVRPPCFLSLPRILHRQDNAHTRRAYTRGATEFIDWLAAKGVMHLADIESIHVATYIEELSRARSAPTAKLRLAALRHLFDWVVIGQIMPTNPAAAVRGQRRSFSIGSRRSGVTQLAEIWSVHVATYIEELYHADREAAPRRAAPPVRLDGDRPDHADQSGRRRARAAPHRAARQDAGARSGRGAAAHRCN